MSAILEGKLRRVRRLGIAAVLACAAAGGGCNRLDDYTAADLHDATKRHPIAYASRPETLYVEVAPGGRGLSANQEADVFRFVERYKAESTGSLRIAAPRSAGAHIAVSTSARQVESIVRSAGIAPQSVEATRYALEAREAPALRLSYDRTIAVAPQCADWGTNLGENRERLPYNDFGCATQRNLALNVANGRDLLAPQEEVPRSSERRSSTWTKYVAAEGGAPQGQSASPTPVAPGGTTPGVQ